MTQRSPYIKQCKHPLQIAFFYNSKKYFNLASDAANPSSYVDYLDGKFTPKYNPLIDCNNCSFTENNRILDDLLNLHKQYPDVDVNELFARIGQYPRKGVNDVDFV